MKAITIDALWAWAIMQGIKRVENRTWPTKYRGRLAIHAGQSRRRDEAARAALEALGVDVPDDVPRGVLLGTVELDDVVDVREATQQTFCDLGPVGLRNDPLATGPICWLLSRPEPLADPVPIGGRLSLWNVDDALLKGAKGLKD